MMEEYKEIKDLRIFQEIEEISDQIWDEVITWDNFAKFTVGKQLVEAIDSVTANMEEADGRYHYKEKINFLYIARGSLKETRNWLRKSVRRKLFENNKGEEFLRKVENLLPQFNSFIMDKKKKWKK